MSHDDAKQPAPDAIEGRGARVHNLKDVDVPLGELVTIDDPGPGDYWV